MLILIKILDRLDYRWIRNRNFRPRRTAEELKPFVVRLLLVAEEYRNRGIGTFLLKNTIELAVRDSCDALFYTTTSQSGQGSKDFHQL